MRATLGLAPVEQDSFIESKPSLDIIKNSVLTYLFSNYFFCLSCCTAVS